MRKFVLLLIAISMIAIHTKAQTGAPFVDRSTVPDRPSVDQTTNELKAAAANTVTGNSSLISGAVVNATAQNYKDVWATWDPSLYDRILAAKNSQFYGTVATGSERNSRISVSSKNAEPTGKVLSAGTLTIGFHDTVLGDIQIAKYGSNGCLNPLYPPENKKSNLIAKSDPDEGGQQRDQTGGNKNAANNSISWNDGYQIWSTGWKDRTIAMYEDALVNKDMMWTGAQIANSSGGCCGTTTISDRRAVINAAYVQDDGWSQGSYQQPRQPSLLGGLAETALFSAAGGFGWTSGSILADRVFYPRNNRGYTPIYYQQPRYPRFVGGGGLWWQGGGGGGSWNPAPQRQYNRSRVGGQGQYP